jgi:NADH-quinone oxidoreductase subunit J
MFPIYQAIFYVFSVVLLGAATMVILCRNPVHSALCLVLAFFASAVLWMLLQAEFLSLVLIFVYVGAVMTLFLFVIMMLNIDLSKMREKFVHYLPAGILVMMLLVATMVIIVSPKNLSTAGVTLQHFGSDYSNTQAMGQLLYTTYIFPFELAGAILLVAIISTIALAFRGRKRDVKVQNVTDQHRVTKKDRLRIVKMRADKS